MNTLSISHDAKGKDGDYRSYRIPIISYRNVNDALEKDFSLIENPKEPEIIITNLSPYFEIGKK